MGARANIENSISEDRPTPSGGEPREDQVVIFYVGFVTGKTRFVLGLVDRFAIDESTKAPTARRGVFSGIFHHDLDCRGGPRNERSAGSRQWHMLPGQL